jgi:hypothetical protein
MFGGVLERRPRPTPGCSAIEEEEEEEEEEDVLQPCVNQTGSRRARTSVMYISFNQFLC